jgi:hypothetical protein
MSGWRTKTNKLGGLPNFTFEPRKTVPLITIFMNGDACQTGIMNFKALVKNAEVQKEKSYYGEKSRLPNGTVINVPCAEVLRMI